jgi:hypothetical protein
VERLTVVNWENHWKDEKECGRIIALEICLWDLLERGSPVEVLEVDSYHRVMNRLEDRWIEDKLIGSVQYKDCGSEEGWC